MWTSLFMGDRSFEGGASGDRFAKQRSCHRGNGIEPVDNSLTFRHASAVLFGDCRREPDKNARKIDAADNLTWQARAGCYECARCRSRESPAAGVNSRLHPLWLCDTAADGT